MVLRAGEETDESNKLSQESLNPSPEGSHPAPLERVGTPCRLGHHGRLRARAPGPRRGSDWLLPRPRIPPDSKGSRRAGPLPLPLPATQSPGQSMMILVMVMMMMMMMMMMMTMMMMM